jgi:pimeloyl-ACP methyl ester carboxylesterase
MEESGILWRPSAYDVEPYPFTKRLVEDARQWLLLDKDTIGIDSTIPVHLIHGQRDEDIKWEKSIEIAEKIQHGNVVVSLVNGGDHRLSSPTDLQRMIAAIKSMI